MGNDNEDSRPISRRDLFAAAALNGLIARGDDNAAKMMLDSLDIADTMLAALDGHSPADGDLKS